MSADAIRKLRSVLTEETLIPLSPVGFAYGHYDSTCVVKTADKNDTRMDCDEAVKVLEERLRIIDKSPSNQTTEPSCSIGESKSSSKPPATQTNQPVRDVFEIREYVDDSGATIKHELLNVSKGREIIEKLHKKEVDPSDSKSWQDLDNLGEEEEDLTFDSDEDFENVIEGPIDVRLCCIVSLFLSYSLTLFYSFYCLLRLDYLLP